MSRNRHLELRCQWVTARAGGRSPPPARRIGGTASADGDPGPLVGGSGLQEASGLRRAAARTVRALAAPLWATRRRRRATARRIRIPYETGCAWRPWASVPVVRAAPAPVRGIAAAPEPVGPGSDAAGSHPDGPPRSTDRYGRHATR